MPKCTRKGCNKSFEEKENKDDSCLYHPGAPVFHEGLKSWSCCKDVNKPVLDFESFMKLPACTTGRHTAEKPVEPTLQTPQTSAVASTSEPPKTKPAAIVQRSTDGMETYSTTALANGLPTISPTPSAPPAPAPVIEDEDDLEVVVAPGTKCMRLGCGKPFVSQEESRVGEGEHSICVYHPAPPIFREGSKGYICCKKRVLDFDDFLKIEGCKTGKHLFAKKARVGAVPGGEMVKCRIDHYQTPGEVHVTVYAKKADKGESSITFDTNQVHLDLLLPGPKRFTQTLNLYGSIDPASSSFTFFGTKVDLLLAKSDARSWNMLEKPVDESILPQGFNLTFGVGGRTGTVGAKEIILDESNKLANAPAS